MLDVVVFGGLGLVMAVVLLLAYVAVRRWRRMRTAWRSGLTAKARCVTAWTVVRGGGEAAARTEVHRLYEFTTRRGHIVRFREEDGPVPTREGDVVTVHYAEGPEVVATTLTPRQGRAAVGVVGMLVTLVVVTGLCVAAAVSYALLSGA
ncbi:hypothetical protein C3489_06435 [Streptomyces sp. Ru71]|uniref:hypothetical protein n=1 Tax=Streptomyces sp. Ru71 TaxID=2080746 RepID=UPI000CDE2132|nr:hypothetical protein [Streptomyces sp. Ru71]POX56069.1 hypothetical protein C3489_06435 [Streptomyces sp. Ru71]